MVMKLQRAGAAAPVETSERRVPSGWGSPSVVAAPEPKADEVATQVAVAQAVMSPDKPTEERKAPSGWGKPASAAAAPQTEEQEQRAEIREKLNPETQGEPEGNAGFSAEVIALKGTVEQGEDPVPFEGSHTAAEAPPASLPKATRSRAANNGPAAQVIDLDAVREAVREAVEAAQPKGVYPTPDEEEKANYALRNILDGAKSAAEAVAALALVNPDAAGETYTLLFGAIEGRLKALGFAAA